MCGVFIVPDCFAIDASNAEKSSAIINKHLGNALSIIQGPLIKMVLAIATVMSVVVAFKTQNLFAFGTAIGIVLFVVFFKDFIDANYSCTIHDLPHILQKNHTYNVANFSPNVESLNVKR